MMMLMSLTVRLSVADLKSRARDATGSASFGPSVDCRRPAYRKGISLLYLHAAVMQPSAPFA
jgi:hypothetical protein